MKLTIITICRNDIEGLKRTFQSIIEQTVRKKFEWIIVDGASTDSTPEYLHSHNNEIDNWISEPDNGIYNAMNKGVLLAKSEYVLFLNSGDTLYNNNVIEAVMPSLDGTSIISGGMECEGHITVPVSPDNLTFAVFYKDSICHPATFIKRQLLLDYPYDETLKIVSDWKFWIETLILKNETYNSIPTVISHFEIDGISCSNLELTQSERDKVLHELIPKRIIDDYNRIFDHSDGNLYWGFMNSRKRKKIYALIIRQIKAISRIVKMPSHIMKLPNSFQ